MIDPEIFLTQEDIPFLTQTLNLLVAEVDKAEDRKGILINAGIHPALRYKLAFEASPQLFANKLVASFREYRVSAYQPTYHPMVSLLAYLLQVYELEDQDRSLFKKLVERGHRNLSMLAARSAVGRIESPLGNDLATGVLVDRQYLLTCCHVFKRMFEEGQEQAWVRFNYKNGRHGIEIGEALELDVKSIVRNRSSSGQVLDYALVRIVGKPEFHPAPLSKDIPCPAQYVHMIHHPRGMPVQISDVGQIIQVDRTAIKHTIEATYGSSGAPIFDLDWHVVALHRGRFAQERALDLAEEGVPIFSIWNDIKPYLHAAEAQNSLPAKKESEIKKLSEGGNG